MSKKVVKYIFEKAKPTVTRVRKFIENVETSGYEIEFDECSCKGFHYASDCKHIQILNGNPPSKAIPQKVARELAKRVIIAFKQNVETFEVEFKGDIAKRIDPVRYLHISIKVNDPSTVSSRIVAWIGGTAVIVDRLTNRIGQHEIFQASPSGN